MIYRVIQRLSVGRKTGYIEPGGTVGDTDLGYRVAAILVKKGAISPVSPPPLNVLPGWKMRAKKFEEAGYNAITLLECDADLIARGTGYHERSIKKWKKELMDFMEVRQGKARRGCGDCDEKAEPPEAAPEPEPEVELTEQVEQTEEVTDATDE